MVLAGAIAAIASPLIPEINSQHGRVSARELSQHSLPVAQVDTDFRTQQWQLDKMADRIFNERHPELEGRKIQPDDTELAAEWQGIRKCDAVVDYIFYNRHPELGGRKIRSDETYFAQEWADISNNVDGCQ